MTANSYRASQTLMRFRRFSLVILISLSALLLSQSYGGENLTARVLLAFALAAWADVIVWAIEDRREHFVALCFCLFNVFGLIVPGMLQSAVGEYPFFSVTYPSEVVVNASVLVALYSIAATVGYRYAWRRGDREKRAIGAAFLARRIHERLAVAAVPLLACASIVLVFAVGASLFLNRRSDPEILLFEAALTSPLPLIKIAVVNDVGFLGLALALILLRGRARISPVTIALTAVAAIAFFVANNPLNQARFVFSAFAIALIGIVIDGRKPAHKGAFAIAYTFGILVAMPILNVLERGSPGSELLSSVVQTYRQTPDYDGFQSIMNVAMWVDQTGLKWGAQLSTALLFFVPHTLWVGKPAATGVGAARFIGYPFTNISAPLAAEFYVDFGRTGVILLSVATGTIFARADRMLDMMRRREQAVLRIPLLLLAGFSAIIARGALLSVIGPVVSALSLSTACALLCSRGAMQRRRLSASEGHLVGFAGAPQP